MKDFFKDLKIVELANVLAGPAVGMFFAELGAEVIKIENKLTNGDVTRSWKLAEENANNKTSAYYASINWGKKSLFMDYNDKNDLKEVYELIKQADIVISNFKFSDKFKFGLDYESVKIINPTIIYGHISGFGPDSSRTAYDLILQAETGYMHMNGTPEVSPLKLPVAFIDIIAAHQMKEALLIALIKKLKTGNGSRVEVSLYDSAISSLANQASNWLTAGHNAQPIGSLNPNIAPYGEIFTTKDNKKMVLAVGSNKQFAHLCNCLDLDFLVTDSQFKENKNRVENRKQLEEILQKKIIQIEAKILLQKFLDLQVPAGIIKSVKDIFEGTNAISHILENKEDTELLRRVKTSVFEIYN